MALNAMPARNNVCAMKERARNDERLKSRIKNMRSMVDMTPPMTVHLDHVRNNLKREQLLEERYHEIDRHNRLLLNKMSDMVKKTQLPLRPKNSKSLTGDNRKQELMRVTQENGTMLRRIQKAQPVYNHVEWEDSYRRSGEYLKLKAEFPIVLKRKASAPGALIPIPRNKAMASTHDGSTSQASGKLEELRYVLKEGKWIGEQYFLVEMATDGRTLAISAYDGDLGQTYEVLVNEQNHRRLYRECFGDYNKIAAKLSIQGDQLAIDLSHGPLDTQGGGQADANADPKATQKADPKATQKADPKATQKA